MGNANGCLECFEVPNYIVYVKTGDTKGAGLHDRAHITLVNERGDYSPQISLNGCCVTVFKAGRTDSFKVRKLPDFGTVKRIIIEQAKEQDEVEWFIEKIVVRHINEDSEGDTIFPIQRWLRNKPLVINEYDSCIPQNEQLSNEQRAGEIAMKRCLYLYKKADEHFPPQMKGIPRDDIFTNHYKWDIEKKMQALHTHYNIPDYERAESWKNFDELEKIFKPHGKYRRPMALKEDWQSDVWFGQQRLRGCNAISLKLCKEIPQNFNIECCNVEGLLDDLSLSEALEQNKLFIVNHSILDNLDEFDFDPDKKQRVPSPMALFYLNNNGDLMPIAIQLYQLPSDDNPVFTPADSKYTWLLAKMWFNNADALFQRVCLLIMNSHFVLGMISLSVHRTLSPSHPIYRLLAPYTQQVLAINHYELNPTLTVGGWLDENTTLKYEGTMELLKKYWQQYEFSCGLNEEIEKNGLRSSDILKDYPLRDDGLLLQECIEKYVTQVVEGYYSTDAELVDDHELQGWGAELVGVDACHLKGIPVDENGVFSDKKGLVQVLSCIICKSTSENAALTLPLYDEGAFVPNYPLMLRGNPPLNKDVMTEADLMAALPTKHTTMELIKLNKILSERESSGLADPRAQYQYDPISLPARERFLGALKEAAANITIRNRERKVYYDYLNPASRRIYSVMGT